VKLPLRGRISFWLYEPTNATLLNGSPKLWVDSTYPPVDDLTHGCLLTFPRFSARDSGDINLIPILGSLRSIKSLNIPSLRVSSSPSAIVQSSKIEVDEHGVSATSTTVMRHTLTIVHGLETIIDHPFTFAIVDEVDNQVLFMGAITDL
jgi:hypothetical protein